MKSVLGTHRLQTMLNMRIKGVVTLSSQELQQWGCIGDGSLNKKYKQDSLIWMTDWTRSSHVLDNNLREPPAGFHPQYGVVEWGV